ncbi:MAG: hypothetical protein LAO77_21440 [Acidobacteriia bacterium]|nr:hypothetical protein [Terriglobia bacterium]
METHVKVLGALQIAMGVFGLVGACILVLVFGGVAGIVGASGDPQATIAVPIIGITGIALVLFLLALSLPSVIVGIGLIGYRPWARVAGIVLSIFGMMLVPFGTVLGIYGVWVLFSKDTEKLFVQV